MRLITFIISIAVLLVLSAGVCADEETSMQAVESSVLQWTCADLIPSESGLSVLRYGAFGLGVYLYGSEPFSRVKITLDGVPLRSFSPFGPDLELIPASVVDSLSVLQDGSIRIDTKPVAAGDPVTSNAFLMGPRHRFHFDMLFNRMLNEKNGVMAAGSAHGIHGAENEEKSGFRHYFTKYQRTLKNGSKLTCAVRAFRDRDGLVDLVGRSHMGERKTDSSSFMFSVKGYPLGSRLSVTPLIYYQSANSRFERYGRRKSLDDDAFGFHTSVETNRKNSTLGLNIRHDVRMFDSRLHDDSWTRNESEISGVLSWKKNAKRAVIQCGYLNSSKYGSGFNAEAELSLPIARNHEWVVRGRVADEFPDTDLEYYPSLLFSEENHVSDLKRYRVSVAETGIRFARKRWAAALYGFGSYSEYPRFISTTVESGNAFDDSTVPPHFTMHGKSSLYGFRMTFDSRIEKRWGVSIKINAKAVPSKKDIQPYPEYECFAGVQAARDFFQGLLKARFHGDSRFIRWCGEGADGSHSSPRGNHFLVNSGVTIRVSSLELFYTVENVTNEDIVWFNTLHWLGRNIMWGGRWVFHD